MANPFEVSGVDSKMRRVSIDRDYLIQILEKSFPALEFPMSFEGSRWKITPQYDPMDMGEERELTGLVVTRQATKRGGSNAILDV